MPLHGVLPAIITPFTPDGEAIDEAALRALVQRQIADGVSGLVPCGSTGEFANLSEAERMQVLEVVADEAGGRVEILAHTGATSTVAAIRLSRHAAQHGATAVILAPPYYGPISDDEVLEYYADVAEQVELPMCLYNFPAASGVSLDTELIVRIAASVDRVQYVKDSSGDLGQMIALLCDHRDDVTVLCGEEMALMPAACLGLTGAVLGCGNLLAPGLTELLKAAAAGDAARIVELNAGMLPLMRYVGRGPYVSVIKTALALLGHPVGPVRRPLSTLEHSRHDELARLLSDTRSELITGHVEAGVTLSPST